MAVIVTSLSLAICDYDLVDGNQVLGTNVQNKLIQNPSDPVNLLICATVDNGSGATVDLRQIVPMTANDWGKSANALANSIAAAFLSVQNLDITSFKPVINQWCQGMSASVQSGSVSSLEANLTESGVTYVGGDLEDA